MHEVVALVAQYLIVVPVLATVVVWLALPNAGKKSLAIIVIFSGMLALILMFIAGKIYYDPRPFVVGHFTPYFSHAPDNGFPSDHTLLASLLGYAVLLYRRRIGIVLLVLALIIGLSRVVAGVHHLLDIAGSFAITFIAVFCITKLYLHFVAPKIEKH